MARVAALLVLVRRGAQRSSFAELLRAAATQAESCSAVAETAVLAESLAAALLALLEGD